jgi:transcriptional regulator with XRE-family HTH domain
MDTGDMDAADTWHSQAGPAAGHEQAGPAVARMLLGARLRELRETAGISQEDAASAIRGSESKICRMELGRHRIKAQDVTDLLDLYKVTADERTTLLALAAETNRAGWWRGYSDVVPDGFQPYLGLKHAAGMIRDYQVQFVPGLLQTADYARAVLRIGTRGTPDPQTDQRVSLRMRRQQILHRQAPPRLWAVIDEAALRRPVGGTAVARAQLEHLIEMAQLSHVRIQIAPFSSGSRAVAAGPVTVLRFPQARLTDMVYLEFETGAQYLNKPAEKAYYWNVLNRLGNEAPPPADSAGILRCILRDT